MRLFLGWVILATGFAWDARGENWPRFRGENGAGQNDTAAIPIEWTADDYLWKLPLPGVGHSSPVVWEGRVYLTSADTESGEQIVLAVDAKTGKRIWEERFASATHHKHNANSFATSTPTIDDKRIYLAWLDGQTVTLVALSHEGAELWRREAGALNEEHGFGTSPVIVGDTICLDLETKEEANSAVIGVDRNSGRELWRTPRTAGKTSYATPCILPAPDGAPLVITTSMGAGLTAYDPASGVVVWNVLAGDLPDRCVSSPIIAAGLVLTSCGSGNNGLHLIAVRPRADGGTPEEAYRVKKGVPNIPTPIVAGELTFLWHDHGTVTCLDSATGEIEWQKRVGGKYHSSPIRIGERIYCTSLDGEVVVIPASKDFEVLARNKIGEPVTATPAVADGRLYLRSEKTLFCLGTKP